MEKKKYWLMKSEPDTFSIDDLAKNKKTLWDGVRNYQARNFMMKEMSPGDEVLFYHSNAQPPGVAGLAKISKKAVPDPTSFDKNSPYYDEKSSKENPRWFCVEVSFAKKFNHFVSLDEIKENKKLKNMLVVKKGQRLSIQPITPDEFKVLCQMGMR
ncbi:MAG: EVE domain-containing protein [Bdellovibrionales bacterium]|nr:EVE domain-containing protein [Bdellovibrionales bacterium]